MVEALVSVGSKVYLDHPEWPPACITTCVHAILELDPHDDLLRRIAEISTMCEEIERAVKSLIALHGAESEALDSARELEATAAALKRQLLQHYLECRIGEAALQAADLQSSSTSSACENRRRHQ
jgi:hypothetical protein